MWHGSGACQAERSAPHRRQVGAQSDNLSLCALVCSGLLWVALDCRFSGSMWCGLSRVRVNDPLGGQRPAWPESASEHMCAQATPP